MDILSKLPFLNSTDDVDKFIDGVTETDLVESKKDRIAFHRAKVRNGPVSYKEPTSGQLRRAQKRALASMSKKAYRKQVRDHIEGRRDVALLRAHLQAAGILPFVHSETQPTYRATYDAVVWVIQRFAEGDDEGKVEVTERVVLEALQAAYNKYQQATGQEPATLPKGYVLPVRIAA